MFNSNFSAFFGLSQIGQIAITVRDLQTAVEFYRDKLGMRHLFDAPNLAFFDCGGIRLMLGYAEKPELDHPASILYFKVEDIQAAYKTFSDRGVKFEGKPHVVARMKDSDLWMVFFRDCENNLFAIMSEVSKTA